MVVVAAQGDELVSVSSFFFLFFFLSSFFLSFFSQEPTAQIPRLEEVLSRGLEDTVGQKTLEQTRKKLGQLSMEPNSNLIENFSPLAKNFSESHCHGPKMARVPRAVCMQGFFREVDNLCQGKSGVCMQELSRRKSWISRITTQATLSAMLGAVHDDPLKALNYKGSLVLNSSLCGSSACIFLLGCFFQSCVHLRNDPTGACIALWF